jgi:hypothetical protein
LGSSGDIADDDCCGADDTGYRLGNLAATQQDVNTAVATRALDATVVHLGGDGDDHWHDAICGASGASGAGRRQ